MGTAVIVALSAAAGASATYGVLVARMERYRKACQEVVNDALAAAWDNWDDDEPAYDPSANGGLGGYTL